METVLEEFGQAMLASVAGGSVIGIVWIVLSVASAF